MTTTPLVMTPAKLIRYAERRHDRRFIDETTAFVASLGEFDPACVCEVEYQPAVRPKLPRIYVTSYVRDNEGVYETAEDGSFITEVAEVVFRGELPHFWAELCAEPDEPLSTTA